MTETEAYMYDGEYERMAQELHHPDLITISQSNVRPAWLYKPRMPVTSLSSSIQRNGCALRRAEADINICICRKYVPVYYCLGLNVKLLTSICDAHAERVHL